MLFYKRHLYYSNQNRMQQYSPAGTAQGRPLPEITPLTKNGKDGFFREFESPDRILDD